MLHDATQMARPVANNNKGKKVVARVREIKPPGHPCFHSRLVYDHDLAVLSGKWEISELRARRECTWRTS